MGFTPRDVGAMSEWEFAAAADGYLRANSPADETIAAPTPAEHDAAIERAVALGLLH